MIQETRWYDILQDWTANVTGGPFGNDELLSVERHPGRCSFLGYSLNSLFGIPACPLTANERFVKRASRLGFDLLTYKSVRSIQWPGNSYPHWRYIDAVGDPRNRTEPFVVFTDSQPGQEVSMANSFGVHSLAPDEWQEDYNRAHTALLPGQLLILSVMPSRIEGKTLVEDAEDLARLASETKAEIVEVNLACPNTDQGSGLIYENVALSTEIIFAMKTILEKRPLLAKVGYYADPNSLAIFLCDTKGVLNGLSSMNTWSGRVVTPEGDDAFPGRPTAGVSGAVIREMAMEQARYAVGQKRTHGFEDFVIIGIGGVTTPDHISRYFDLGVDAVQSAVGAYEDSSLAAKYLRTLAHG